MSAALAEELTEHLATKSDLRVPKSGLLPLKWMIGFNLACTATILWRVIDLV